MKGNSALFYAVKDQHDHCALFLLKMRLCPHDILEKTLDDLDIAYQTKKLISMAKLIKNYMIFTNDVPKHRRDQIFKKGIAFMHHFVSFLLFNKFLDL